MVHIYCMFMNHVMLYSTSAQSTVCIQVLFELATKNFAYTPGISRHIKNLKSFVLSCEYMQYTSTFELGRNYRGATTLVD